MEHGGMGDYWSRYTLDPDMEQTIELIDTEVTHEEATAYLAMAYRKFYFRPIIFWRRLRSLKTFGEFKRVARGAFGLIKNSAQLSLANFSFSHPEKITKPTP